CPNCRYVLFGLSEPRCPECGQGFKVTDYAFTPGAVHFLCPHCGQGYAGNDQFGLPWPRTFQCIKCKKFVAAASMSVQPVHEGAIGEPLRFGHPWEHREVTGFIRAFRDSLGRIAVHPRLFFGQSYGGDRSGADFFAVLCGYLCAGLLLIGVTIADALGAGLPWRMTVGRVLIMLVLAFVSVPPVVYAWNYAYGLIIQLILAMMGDRTSDFEQTVQVVAYSTALWPAMIFPPVGLVWYLSVVSAGLREMHGLSNRRAIAAAVVPILIYLNLLAGLLLYFL
ncbi:MAG: Yip1 family protein, partial [Phycisphaerae bacterium]